ncbi:MAG: hypothetical protein ABIR57_08680 [Aeromicrobium sp.]
MYPKGSYPNHTNVVRDSDVDVAVELTSIEQHEFIHSAKGLTITDFGLTRYTGDYSVPKFKDDVEAALRRQFGSAAVERGNKAIHVKESRMGIKADVVVCQTLKSHSSRYADARTGILIEPDHGQDIHNFPKHHLDEGVAKNTATSRRYKRLVRIVKRLENEMVAAGVVAEVPSFLMESMVWNVPNPTFTDNSTWTLRLRAALGHIYHADRSEWLEANKIKFLFHPSQGWTETSAMTFIEKAWNYMEFE